MVRPSHPYPAPLYHPVRHPVKADGPFARAFPLSGAPPARRQENCRRPKASRRLALQYQAMGNTLPRVEVLLPAVRAHVQALAFLPTPFWQHPDAPLFASLTGAGTLLAPGLSVKFGDRRQRFPRPRMCRAWRAPAPSPSAVVRKRMRATTCGSGRNAAVATLGPLRLSADAGLGKTCPREAHPSLPTR